MERNKLLDTATGDIIDLLTAGLDNLKKKEVLGVNETKMLEIYNKIVTVCLQREKGKTIRDDTTDLTDEELESSFE